MRKDSYNPVVKLQKDPPDSDIGEVLEEKVSDAVSVRRQAVRMKRTDTFMSACRSRSFWVWRWYKEVFRYRSVGQCAHVFGYNPSNSAIKHA